MNKTIKKSILFTLIFIILLIGVNIYTSVKDNNREYESDVINKNGAKTLEIYNDKITNLSERNGKDSTATVKMKNTSDLNISQIDIHYNELDKNNKVISASKIDMDITLSPDEVMQVDLTPKDYTDTIEIVGYTYIVEDCLVDVNLKENDVKILENEKYLENSKNYEVMSINRSISEEENFDSDSKIKDTSQKATSDFSAKIKNISQKNLGNIVLKVAEINKNKEIVKIDHIIYNSILKPNEEAIIDTSLYNSNYDVKILGYTYDDMENKSNIDIDLITHKVNIIDNKK